MRLKGTVLAAILWGGVGLAALPNVAAAQGLFANLPRNETLILENPEGTIKNAGWFNIWAINAGSQSNGLATGGAGHALVHRPQSRPRRGVAEFAGRR